MEPQIAPSLLAADFSNLKNEIKQINKSDAFWIHLDVMDGVFVPNISFGMPIIKSISKYATKPLDVHLMIVQPERYISKFKELGASTLTVHYESCAHLHRVINAIKVQNMKAGVALNPHTPVCMLEDIIRDLDLVCLMSVNPGFGGQTFIEHTYQKIKKLKKMIIDSGSQAVIEVDGGITDVNAKKNVQCGADILVAGSFVFGNGRITETINQLNKKIK